MNSSIKKDIHTEWIEESTVILNSYLDLQKQLHLKKSGFTFEGKPLNVTDVPGMKKEVAVSISFWRNHIKEHKAELNKFNNGLKGPTKNKNMATKKKSPAKKKCAPAKKKTPAKKKCEPTAAQKRARAAFAANAKKAAKLVDSGKAKTLKAAWKQLK